MGSTMDTGKAKANTVSIEELRLIEEQLRRIKMTNMTFTTPPQLDIVFVPPEFLVPHTAEDLLKRAISSR